MKKFWKIVSERWKASDFISRLTIVGFVVSTSYIAFDEGRRAFATPVPETIIVQLPSCEPHGIIFSAENFAAIVEAKGMSVKNRLGFREFVEAQCAGTSLLELSGAGKEAHRMIASAILDIDFDNHSEIAELRAEVDKRIEERRAEDPSFDAIAGNVTTSIETLPGVLTGVAYMVGITLGVLGVLKIKGNVENPTQTRLQHGALRLTAGGGLYKLPIVYEAMTSSIGSEGTAVTAAPLQDVESGLAK